MVTFKEYYQGDKYMNPKMQSGKDRFGGMGRKHQTNIAQVYKHDCSQVAQLVNGGASQLSVSGQQLMNILQQYKVDFAPNQTKGLGNSGVEVRMFIDANGAQCGILTKK